MVPYLCNYSGHAIFMDCDMLSRADISLLWRQRTTKYAVQCVQHDYTPTSTIKFMNQPQTPYPKKNWSSMMIFNNGHEDCKKLTPEVVNTWTGAQLHQFEWTDKISSIPEKFIFTEGYDNPEEKWDVSGYHYTRGGPWIKNMECSKITRLDAYEKMKSLYYSK